VPLGVGADGYVADVQLTEERDGVPVTVARLLEAGAAAIPPVAENDFPDVLARDEDAADVVGLHVQVGPVTGEAGGQLHVADAVSVEECLVAAVRGRVEAGFVRDRAELERSPEHVRRTLPRSCSFGLVRLDPARAPVGGVEEGRLEPRVR
jgi:hypothetical protein